MNKRKANGSVTVEAALILPFFLYFMMNLLTLFDALRVQTALLASLHQTGREIASYAFDIGYGADILEKATGASVQGTAADLGSNVLSAAYADQRVKTYMEILSPNLRCVKGGRDGLSLLRSGWTSDADIIDLTVSCTIRPFISIAGFDAFPVEARYYAHAWTGYRIAGTEEGKDGDEDEEIVYVTPTGTVYHRSSECTYLKPSVKSVNAASLSTLRNDSGAIYYACESCGGGSGEVYITTYGTRYHASASCNKLERTIRAVKLSEVAGMPPCSKCGGAH